MGALAGILGFLIMSIVIGKRVRRLTARAYLVVVVIALLQTAYILYYVFTMPYPEL